MVLQFDSELVSWHEEGAAMYGHAGLLMGLQTAHLTNPKPGPSSGHIWLKVQKVRRTVHA